jgi:hypothetical protein
MAVFRSLLISGFAALIPIGLGICELCRSTPAFGAGAELTEMKKRLSQPWTPEDEVRLRTLAAAGRSAATISERLKRSVGAVRYRASALNIILQRVKRGSKVKGKE